MKTRRAPRRVIDAYVALIEGFVLVDGPARDDGTFQPVLIPREMVDSGWRWKRGPLDVLAFVPEFCRDWGTGGPIMDREGIYPAPDDGPPLEAAMRELVRRRYGDELPADSLLFIARQAS